MFWKSVVVGALSAVAAFGINVNSTNTRPVNIGASPASEDSLQKILDGIFGVGALDAVKDQKSAAMFNEPGNAPQTVAPIIQATFTAGGDELGIFSGTDFFGDIHKLEIFKPTASNHATATILFNPDNTITIYGPPGSCASDINCQTNLAGSGIDQHNFGFYIEFNYQGQQATYYSADNGNPDSSTAGATFPAGSPAEPTTQARVLTYNGPGNKWAIAFEDYVDFDYNDRVLTVESIVPVPEPAAITLFGTALIAVAVRMRKRRAQ